jgi:Protein of unknown function DUF262
LIEEKQTMKKQDHSEIINEERIKSAESQIVTQSKRIEFYLTEYSIELLASKMQSGEFFIPNYQREDTWEPSRKSRFIESVLMGLPIPFLFFWENPETGKLEVVDGSQRLRTLEQFLYKGMVLGKLETLTDMEGLAFKDLPESRQLKIKNRSIRGIVLNEHADEQARFDLFDRINTGSKIANEAEVRRGALGGPFLRLVMELSEYPLFKELAPVPQKAEKQREREELVTRFFAYSDGLDGYKDRVAPFLFNYARRMNQLFTDHPELIKEYRERFVSMLNFVSQIFPDGFRRAKNGRKTPRARFEAIAIGTYLALAEQPGLSASEIKSIEWVSSKEFQQIVGADGANAIGRLKGRLHFVRDQLLGRT